MKTYFEIAVDYFNNDHEDEYIEFSHHLDKGVHTIKTSFDGNTITYTFDEDVVDELNTYLDRVYRLNEDLYDDTTDFLYDAFFDCLEDVIDGSELAEAVFI